MKTFQNFVNLRELAAYDIGTDLFGRTSLDDKSEEAISAALRAFMLILSHNTQAALNFLERSATLNPEVAEIVQQLQRYDTNSFKNAEFKTNVKKAAIKGGRFVSKGLGDVSPADAGADVVTPNVADSMHNPLN